MTKEKDWIGNKKSTFVTLGASNHTDHDRAEYDYYATEPKAIDALLEAETFDKSIPIWENCCGEGHLSKRLEELGEIRAKSGRSQIVELLQGDCLEKFKNIQDKSIDLIVTDPPYRITAKGCAGSTGGMLRKQINMQGRVFDYNNIKPVDYAKEFYRVLKDGSHCYVMTNHVNLINMLNTFTNEGFHFIKCLIWDKCNKIMGRFYMSQFEYIMFFRKGKGIQINNCGTSDILKIPNIKTKGEDKKNLHDTEKPVELMKILVENSSRPNDIILDPFMGIGTTGIACCQCERDFIGIEIDKKYFSIAKQRIEHTKNVVKEQITFDQPTVLRLDENQLKEA